MNLGTDKCRLRVRVDCMTRTEDVIVLTYAVISFLRSLARLRSPGLSIASGFEHPASTSRLAFLQRSASARYAYGLANACALVYVAA